MDRVPKAKEIKETKGLIFMVHIFPTFSEAIKIVAQSFKHDPKRMSCCVE